MLPACLAGFQPPSTPALVVARDAFDENLREMQAHCEVAEIDEVAVFMRNARSGRVAFQTCRAPA